MDGWLVILATVPATYAASWFGGSLHSRIAHSHIRLQMMLSFVGGLMLGMALLHLIPHSIVQLGAIDPAMMASLAGVLGTFLLIRFLHVHSHEVGGEFFSESDKSGESPATAVDDDRRPSSVRWIVLLTGLGLHSVVDGLAIASAVAVACGHNPWGGLSVLIAVMLHKPIDAVSLTSTMAAAGESEQKRRLLNGVFALITPIATVAAYGGLLALDGAATGVALGVAGGAFICVALADLMPEVQFHSHHRVRLTLALGAGVGLAWLIGVFEPEHHHHLDVEDHAREPAVDHSGHSHH